MTTTSRTVSAEKRAVQWESESSPITVEFRRHHKITNKVHVIGFLSQWKMYLDQLPAGPDGGKAFRGKPLDPTTLEKVCTMTLHPVRESYIHCLLEMSAEQLSQLYEVMHASKDVWKPVSPEQDGSTESSGEHKS